ncbi:MAG: tetratricopeptide repeat protein [Planctomycetes bacterium]|nr:tetratricopeptide repeat protein [Planctomycetota bacterium]
MLKFTYLAQLGLAGTLLAPAVVQKQDPAGGLTDALANTRASIASLERLHTALTEGEYAKVSTTIEATQTPETAARAQDERLSYLRDEVSRLQMRWDSLELAMSSKPTVTSDQAVAAPATAPPADETEPTTGLNEETRAALAQQFEAEALSEPAPYPHHKVSYEPAGYTAHAVRHGRAYYKAGRFEEALSLLQHNKDQAGARFWIACTLEKLGETEAAIAAYQGVIESSFEAENAEHARRNRDFLVWKRDFDARISTTSAAMTPRESE